MMKTYRQKPPEVNAIQFRGDQDSFEEVRAFLRECHWNGSWVLETQESQFSREDQTTGYRLRHILRLPDLKPPDNTLREGDWLVWESWTRKLSIMRDTEFNRTYEWVRDVS